MKHEMKLILDFSQNLKMCVNYIDGNVVIITE